MQYTFYSCLVIGSTNLQIIKQLQLKYGGNFYETRRPDVKIFYTWEVTGSYLKKFLDDIYPYLIIKKKEADVIYKFLKTRINKKTYSSGIPDSVIKKRELLKSKLELLRHE